MISLCEEKGYGYYARFSGQAKQSQFRPRPDGVSRGHLWLGVSGILIIMRTEVSRSKGPLYGVDG